MESEELPRPVAEDENEGDIEEANVIEEMEDTDEHQSFTADNGLCTSDYDQLTCSTSDDNIQQNEQSSTVDTINQQKGSTSNNDNDNLDAKKSKLNYLKDVDTEFNLGELYAIKEIEADFDSYEPSCSTENNCNNQHKCSTADNGQSNDEKQQKRNLRGKRKTPVAYIKPNAQRNAVLSVVSHNTDRFEHNDYLTDEFDDIESSGSEYIPKSSEEDDDYDDDDDDDCRSVEFPMLKMTQKVRSTDNSFRSNSKEANFKKRNSEGKIQEMEKNSELEENVPKIKAYFKNIHIETYEKNNGKRNYKKTDYCCFCKHPYDSKISSHILGVHGTESKVIEIRALALKSIERKMALQKLQKEGNYYHNLEVLKNGEGTLIVYRRPKTNTCASEFIPCEYCMGFFHESHLWEHAKGCYFRKNEVESSKNYVRNGRIMIMPFIIHKEGETNKLDDVISRMKETKENPGLKEVCLEDKLIREFGMCLLERLGTSEEQRRKDEDNIRTKLRCVARLLKKLNDKKIVNQPLTNYINAREFNAVVTAVKDLYRESNSPQLAISLGNYLKQITLLKASLAIQEENDRKKIEANNFLEMHAAHWLSRVKSVANRTQRLRAINSSNDIPSTEDLVELKNYITKEMKVHMKNKTPTYDQYVKMAQLLIVRIALFNKRRISEVDELTVIDYEKRIRGSEIGNSEIIQSLEFSERALLKRMELIQVRGKSTRKIRKVYILLSNDMVEGVEHILATRLRAGVNPKNKYVFARTGTSASPQDGCTAMRQISADCKNLSNPNLIRTRLLRKYLATTTQIMDMTGDELKLVADHMGHSVAIHTDIYRLQSSLLERTKVARALVALEEGKLGNYKGRSLSSISIDELPRPVAEDENEGDIEEANVIEEMEDTDEHQSFTADNGLCTADCDQLTCSTSDDNIQQNEQSSTVDTINQQKGSTVLNDQLVERPKQNDSRGIKRSRWTKDEEKELIEAFYTNIQNKKNVSTTEIRRARKKFKNLEKRSEAVIRSKINNVVLGKTHLNLQ